MSIPDQALQPATVAEMVELVREHQSRRPNGPQLVPVGGATTFEPAGWPANAKPVSLSRLNALVDYPARDMTITVQAGMTFATLQRHLSQECQRLPIDLAQPNEATIGGAMGCNAAGPLRYGYGSWRDYVIGLTAVDAAAREFHSGGRVVKNVAGYDLCKLAIGSRGALGITTQITLKVRPQAACLAWWWTAWDSFAALEMALQRLLKSEARPVAVEAADVAMFSGNSWPPVTGSGRIACAIGVEGSIAEVQWQLDRLYAELVPLVPDELSKIEGHDAEQLRASLTGLSQATPSQFMLRAALRPSRAMAVADTWRHDGLLVHAQAGSGIVWACAPEHQFVTTDRLSRWQNTARQAGGYLQPWSAAAQNAGLELFDRAADSYLLMCRLKQSLDPNNLWVSELTGGRTGNNT